MEERGGFENLLGARLFEAEDELAFFLAVEAIAGHELEVGVVFFDPVFATEELVTLGAEGITLEGEALDVLAHGGLLVERIFEEKEDGGDDEAEQDKFRHPQ